MKRTHDDDRPILVPVDFSSHSAAALLWAAEAARNCRAPLIVLHVVHDPAEAPGYYAAARTKGELQRLEDAAGEMMEQFLAREREAHPEIARLKQLTTSLVVGLPARRILEVADKTKARLIVMGSQGRTGLSHLLIGSKAERVIQLASIPVTIVKARDCEPEDREAEATQ